MPDTCFSLQASTSALFLPPQTTPLQHLRQLVLELHSTNMPDNESLHLVSSATKVEGERVFDFFGLPAEVRNEIYSMLTEDIIIEDGYLDIKSVPGAHITIRQKGLLRPLLLNRRFKEEYQEEVDRHQTLVFQDNGDQWPTFNPCSIMSKVSRVTLRLLIECSGFEFTGDICDCFREVGDHMLWIQRALGTAKSPKHLKIELWPYLVDTRVDTQHDKSWLENGTEAIARIRQMSVSSEDFQIEVYSAVKRESNRLAHTVYDDERPPIGKWSRASGWQGA